MTILTHEERIIAIEKQLSELKSVLMKEASKPQPPKPLITKEGLYLTKPELGTKAYEPDGMGYRTWKNDPIDNTLFKTCNLYVNNEAAEFEREKRELLHDILVYCAEEGFREDEIIPYRSNSFNISFGKYIVSFHYDHRRDQVFEHFKERIRKAQRNFTA